MKASMNPLGLCQFLIGKVQLYKEMQVVGLDKCQFLIGKVQQIKMADTKKFKEVMVCQFLIGKVQQIHLKV